MISPKFVIISLACMALALSAYGWPRSPISDQCAVERAELILVGRIQPDSIKCVDHPTKPGAGHSCEHHANLEIVETLKGSPKATTIEIIIHHGLYPVTGRYVKTKNFFMDLRGSPPSAAKDAIEIFDTGDMCGGRISGDIREPQIWLLRSNDPQVPTPESTVSPGIWDPEDIQPITKKKALMKWISK